MSGGLCCLCEGLCLKGKRKGQSGRPVVRSWRNSWVYVAARILDRFALEELPTKELRSWKRIEGSIGICSLSRAVKSPSMA